jgi:hypothetical protein
MTQQTFNLTDFPPGLVAIPAQDWMWTESANAFLFLTQGLPPGSALRFGRASSSAEWNRNRLTEEFLRDAPSHGWEWILYIDSDMVPQPATALRLLSHNVDCVGGYYFSRREPLVAEFNRVGTAEAQPVNGLLPCMWVGAGCLLVRKTVLDRMGEPWWDHAPNPGEGEDIVFAAKVRALGVPVHVDLGCGIGHMAARPITKRDADAYFASPEGKAAMGIATPGSESYVQRQRDAVALASAER